MLICSSVFLTEDEILAKSVPELDLIISGHTHTKLDEAIVHGNTYIVSAGEYGKYLGNLSMTQKEEGVWVLDSYELITVDTSINPDGETQEKVDELTACLKADGYEVVSGPRTTGDGYYESCVVGLEGNQIEITV